MKILVLAGGADQIALINELKDRGHKVILADYFDNPPAKEYADHHYIVSTLDTDAIKKLATQQAVDLIITACTDQALLTAAKVSEDLHLPTYISYNTAQNVTNKSYMKRVMADNSIPTSKYIICNKYEKYNFNDLNFPLVVKPVDCNSSKGVQKIFKEEDLKIAIDKAVALSRTNTSVVEEFLEGIEISADFYIEEGQAKLLSATSSSKIKNKTTFTITQSIYPVLNDVEERETTHIAQKIADSFKLTNTPLLIQLIKNTKGFYVIEFSARMGGGSKYKLIQELSGVNIMSSYVDLVLGDKPSVKPAKQVDYAMINYIYCHPGTFDRVENLEYLKAESVIKDYFIYKTSGMHFEKAETSGDRAAGYLIVGKTKSEIIEKSRLADKTLKVIDKSGKDIMIHNLV